MGKAAHPTPPSSPPLTSSSQAREERGAFSYAASLASLWRRRLSLGLSHVRSGLRAGKTRGGKEKRIGEGGDERSKEELNQAKSGHPHSLLILPAPPSPSSPSSHVAHRGQQARTALEVREVARIHGLALA